MTRACGSGDRQSLEWRLRLYISGQNEKNAAVIQSVTELCKERLQGHFNLEVIDLNENPGLADSEQLLALPMLLRLAPGPVRRLIGDLTDREATAVALNLGLAP